MVDMDEGMAIFADCCQCGLPVRVGSSGIRIGNAGSVAHPADECVLLLKRALFEARTSLAKAEEELEKVRPVVDAAHGLSHGEDWNNGVQATVYGFRRALLKALGRYMGPNASPRAKQALTKVD